MKKLLASTVLTTVCAVVLPSLISAEELIEIEFSSIKDLTVEQIRFYDNPPDTVEPLMTLEEFRKWNTQYPNATDKTIIPAMSPIRYFQKDYLKY